MLRFDLCHSFKYLFSYSFIKLLQYFYPFESFVHHLRSKIGGFYRENGFFAF